MGDAITQATKQVVELARLRKFLAVRGVERFVFELAEVLTEAGIQDQDQADIFLRLSTEASRVFETTKGA